MNGKIKVKCVKENIHGFVVGETYDAYRIKSAVKNKERYLGVVDRFGEEYCYSIDLFEVIEE